MIIIGDDKDMIIMNLKYLMIQKGINKTVKEMAEETEIPRNTLRAYLNNDFKMINREHLNKLVKYFNCSVGDLISFEEQLNMDLESLGIVKTKTTSIDELPDAEDNLLEDDDDLMSDLFGVKKPSNIKRLFESYTKMYVDKYIQEELDTLLRD